MNAEEIYKRLEESFGHFNDSGVLNCNGRDIKDVVWEVDQEYLYPFLRDPDVLYAVHHPVSRFNLNFEEDSEPDEEADNYILEYRAKRLGLNLICAHTIADKIMETELRSYLKGRDRSTLIEDIRSFYRQFVNFEFTLYVSKRANNLLKSKKDVVVNVNVATYDYRLKKKEIFVDELGATPELEDKRKGYAYILVPHSVIDISAMSILEREIRKILQEK